jgi:predicted lipoprotein with Yx(FWY)xxD motif
MRQIWGAAGLAAIALVVTACASSGSTSAAAGNTPAAQVSSQAASSAPAATSSGNSLVAKTIGGKQVLTNAAGFTLYWFAPDTATTSKCTGSCATYWPPVKGPLTAGAGVAGKLGTITRTDGTTQATYNGHPLYTYAGDTAAGDNKGNGLNASGGLWYDVPVTASATTGTGSAPTPAATKTAKTGGGYGY